MVQVTLPPNVQALPLGSAGLQPVLVQFTLVTPVNPAAVVSALCNVVLDA